MQVYKIIHDGKELGTFEAYPNIEVLSSVINCPFCAGKKTIGIDDIIDLENLDEVKMLCNKCSKSFIAEAKLSQAQEMKIETSITANGFSVEIPFELSNQFQKHFPSAKRSRNQHRSQSMETWEAGPRSGKRLNQWIKHILEFGTLDELENRDQKELNRQEVEELEQVLQKIKQNINEKLDGIESLKAIEKKHAQVSKLITQHKKKLAIVCKKIESAKEKKQQTSDKVKTQLSKIIDFDSLLGAQRDMSRQKGVFGKNSRSKWDEAQATIADMHSTLKASGLQSYGLDVLEAMNHNRPDRDIPNDITVNDILDIKEVV